MVRQASQLRNEGHLFNFLDWNREEVLWVQQHFTLANREEVAFKNLLSAVILLPNQNVFQDYLVHLNDKSQRQEDQVKGRKSHVLFGSAWKWSSLCKGCSLCAVQSTAGQTLGKPMVCFLPEQVGRCRASSAPLSPKFYTHTHTALLCCYWTLL